MSYTIYFQPVGHRRPARVPDDRRPALVGLCGSGLLDSKNQLSSASPFATALLVYGLALLIEVFVASGSAKAFLVMPILLPLDGLVGLTSQTTVLTYCFGDGFSNLMYPSNPVLLICLGLTTVRYSKWLAWSLPLWLAVIAVSVAFLGLAVAIGYGPF